MTEKELKRLGRRELLEMLIDQSRKTERLQSRLAEAEENLSNRDIDISESGNIADAALKLNGVFEAAQKASDDYLERAKKLESDARAKSDEILSEAKALSDGMKDVAERQKEDFLAEAKQLKADAQTDAEIIRAEAEQTLENAKAEAERLYEEAKQIKTGAQTDADVMRAEAEQTLENAKAEAERIMEKAKTEAEWLRNETNDACVEMLGLAADEMEAKLAILRETLESGETESADDGAERHSGNPEEDAGNSAPEPIVTEASVEIETEHPATKGQRESGEKKEKNKRPLTQAEKAGKAENDVKTGSADNVEAAENGKENHDFDFSDDVTEDFEAIGSITDTIDVAQIRSASGITNDAESGKKENREKNGKRGK